MHRKIHLFGAGVLVLTSLALTSPAQASDSNTLIEVRMEDRCDPATFNGPVPVGLGPGSCVPVKERGTVTLAELVDTLLSGEFGHDGWRFSRTDFSIKQGGKIRVKNIGGEVHSFTKVAAFGGGCVPEINDLLGGLTPVAECLNPATFATLQGPGQSRDITVTRLGKQRFMCIIHPWMRATVTVTR